MKRIKEYGIIVLIALIFPALAFAKSPDVCLMAQRRLIEVQKDWGHKGFAPLAQEQFKLGVRGWFYENLARGFKDEKGVMAAWKNSPKHNANLMIKATDSCLVSANGHWVLIKYRAPK